MIDNILDVKCFFPTVSVDILILLFIFAVVIHTYLLMFRLKNKILLAACLFFSISLTVGAEDSIPLRGCRPQLYQKGIPTHAASSYRVPAVLSGEKQVARRAEGENPWMGDRRQLVVMVAFPDQSFLGDREQTLELWGKIFNAKKFQEEPFCGSVHDYFYDQSYGQFRLTFDLHFFTLSDNMQKYRSTSSDDENSKYMVQEVVEFLKNEVDDWEQYDWDGDGYVDQFIIIYAGKGQNAGGSRDTIWPHQWWLSKHDNCEAIAVTSGDKDYFVDCYCCVQELFNKNDYGSFGTICHEYSHCFGFPDFYGSNARYVDTWDVMDYGNYNGDGLRPCGYSAFERTYMGWMTPEELIEETSVTDMAALSDEPQAYLIRNDGHSDEYYIVENRQQKGWDANLPGSGIIIFHVDYDEYVFHYDMPNTTSRKRYTIFPANNRTTAVSLYTRGWAYPYNDNNELTNTSQPAATLNNANTDDTFFMSKPVTEMAVDGGLASFCFLASTDGIDELTDDSRSKGEGRTYYDLSGRYVGNDSFSLPRGIYVVKEAEKVTKIVKR